jgi:transposase-like protein
MAERRRTYSADEKAAALADVVLIGPGATAAKHGIPIRTLFGWRAVHGIADLAPLKKDHIGALVATYLEANLQALTAQAYVASQPEYIERQPAEGLAVLHGVMADKSIRLLEALHTSAHDSTVLDAG